MPTLGNYTATTNLYEVLLGAAGYAKTNLEGLAQAFQTRAAGSSADTLIAQQSLAKACNRIHDQLVYQNPAINNEEADLTLVAGTLEYDIPEALMRASIDRIYVVNTTEGDDTCKGFVIEYCSPNDFLRMFGPPQQASGNASWFPRNWTMVPKMNKIWFSSFQASGTYRMVYHTAVDLWDVDDVTDAESTVYAAVPDTFIDVLQMQIALAVCLRNGDTARIALIKEELYSAASRSKRSRYDELRLTLANVGATDDRQTITQGLPHTGSTPLRMGGAGGRGRGGFRSGYGGY